MWRKKLLSGDGWLKSMSSASIVCPLCSYCDRFNKRLEDFDDLRSYNDYLEEVEDIGERVPLPIINVQSFDSLF